MNQEINETKQSFNAAFAVLERNAQMLRDNSSPDIDKLVSIVTESVEAYGAVKTRLNSIDEALKLVFGNLDEQQ